MSCIRQAIAPALKTSRWILSITVPVSFGVLLLKLTGLLPVMARVFAPLFAWLGMPGESALVFVTAGLVNIYACIGVISTLDLSSRTVTILALMCLISHNLPVEAAVQKRTGTPWSRTLLIRLTASFTGAAALNILLPPDGEVMAGAANSMVAADWGSEVMDWLAGTSFLCFKIVCLITLLMILQRILQEFGITRILATILKVPLMVLGIPHQAAFLWIVANTLGLAYGAGVMIDEVERGKLSARNADILNHHIAISHSLLEDTLLFVAVGVPALWITVPRLILAGIAVWLKRFLDWAYGTGERSRLSLW
jgi:spore maturation protein SpmB